MSVHQRNLQLLLITIYRAVNNLNPVFMTQAFVAKDVPYNFRDINSLALPKARTNLYGTDTIRFVGKNLYQRVQIEIKEPLSVEISKQRIKLVKKLIAAVGHAKFLIQT